jgi:lactate permease
MWSQNYTPVNGSLGLSALVACLPLIVTLVLLAGFKKPAWLSALSGAITALLVALIVYGMPASAAFSTVGYGAAYGLLPITWIIFTAILLYRLTVETGKFEVIKDSIGSVTADRRLQALLIAFAFGAFLEGASGFGTPVAVAAAMMTGMGFTPFYAAAICLLANTAPVAFGAIGTPLVMLQTVTGLPMSDLSANVGRICAPLSMVVPSYLMLVMGGWGALRAVFPAAIVCGVAFGGMQFLVSSFVGPYLTDILGALVALLALVVLLKVWHPKGAEDRVSSKYSAGQIMLAWSPYIFLVFFVLLWNPDWMTVVAPDLGKTVATAIKTNLNLLTWKFGWPALHNLVIRMPPVTAKPSPYDATYTFNIGAASGTACLMAVFLSALVSRVSPMNLLKWVAQTAKQLMFPTITVMSVLALAYLMNYSGATATLGLTFAATGVLFPFFSSLLGWVAVFLTGSDTSANALFGSLQVVTAMRLGMNAALMAAANSSGGVMGKMISLQNVAVASVATNMTPQEESKLFRFTLRHSVLMAVAIGLVVMFYAYVAPGLVR